MLDETAYVLVLGSDVSVVSSIVEALDKRSQQFIWLTPQHFVEKVDVRDEIDHKGDISICWKYEGIQLTDGNILGVVNLLASLTKSDLAAFAEDDIDFAASEYIAYFVFSLWQLKRVLNRPSRMWCSPDAGSFPDQWRTISSHGVQCPKHYCCCLPHKVFSTKDLLNLVTTKDLYDYCNWESRDARGDQDTSPYFHYVRPDGYPVLVPFVSSRLWFYDVFQQKEYKFRDLAHRDKIVEVQAKLASNFHIDFGEMLFFCGTELTFGYCRPRFSWNSLIDSVRSEIANCIAEEIVCFNRS